MSIQSEIERISQAKTDIHSSIESKGVTVPDDTLISEMAPYIQQIREAGTVVTSVSNIGPDESGNAQLKNLRIYCGEQDITYNGGTEQTLTINPATVRAATAAQGAKADTAVQPDDLSPYAKTADLPNNLPNPYNLSIRFNGTTQVTYNGSSQTMVNITPNGIGAASFSDLAALEPLVGTTSNTTPLQVYNALSEGRQCFITDSSITTIFSSWVCAGNTDNGVVTSSVTHPAGDEVIVGALSGNVSNGQWFTTTMPINANITASSIGAAPIMHSVTDTTYGVGTQNYYGHVRLSDSLSSSYGQTSGVAATPLAVSSVNSRVANVEDAIASLTPITKIVLLWTNSSPSSTFPAKKVSLSLSGYHAVLVLGWSYSAEAVCSSILVPVGSKGVITLVGTGMAYRNFTTSTTGITFEAASVENTATPYKIYGIKL